MIKHFKILILLLFATFSCMGQASFSSKVFHEHFQTCHFVGTTEEDLIVVLNSDLTISLTRYYSNYFNQYNTFTRQTYNGTYSKCGDTIQVTYTDYSSVTKRKIKETNASNFAKKVDTLFIADNFFQYPPTTYITSSEKIVSVNSVFPTLKNSTAFNIMLIESKFINWDKGSFYKKKPFAGSK